MSSVLDVNKSSLNKAIRVSKKYYSIIQHVGS